MTETPDLFGSVETPRYPDIPGRRRVDTSIEAAEHIGTRAATLREAVLLVLRRHPDGLTADEVAGLLRKTVLGIRPRLTELKRMGRVRDSGLRRENRSGRRAAVMIVETPGHG
jgi:hypothetical protein